MVQHSSFRIFNNDPYDVSTGKGTYTWANGDKYIGEWNEDKKHGKGVFSFANGRKKEGTWENDVKHVRILFDKNLPPN